MDQHYSQGLQLLEKWKREAPAAGLILFPLSGIGEEKLQMLKEIVELFERPDIVEKEFVKWE